MRNEQTGGEHRTPRSEITGTRAEGKKYEPALALDFSPSMFWGADDENDRGHEYPSPLSRRAITDDFIPLFVGRLAGTDTEAAAEQASGDSSKGGVFSVGFTREVIELEDLNEANVRQKLDEGWEQAQATEGGTKVTPAVEALIADYEEEFDSPAKRAGRVHEITIVTDGQPEDPRDLIPLLHDAGPQAFDASDTAKENGGERVYLVAILGHGTSARKTADMYEEAARENEQRTGRRNVHVVIFDAVTNPVEIAQDMITLAS